METFDIVGKHELFQLCWLVDCCSYCRKFSSARFIKKFITV